ncbi:MAG: InlB B-repeat-containing protein [Muribaculaceae bacterium]
MRKFYLLLVVALFATSSAFADITYELNGGQPNPYGWNSKDDMYEAFMTDAGVTGYVSIAEYQERMVVDESGNITTDGLHSPGICVQLKEANAKQAFAMTEKWGWLETYIIDVYDKGSAPEGQNKSYRADYAAGAFFLCSQSLTFPAGPSFAEAGKDEAYLPSWDYCYAFPTTVTEATTLKNPYREGSWEFAGWYNNAEFTGDPITTINADFAGTLYAKWKYVRVGITYDLNGGSNKINNPYGWTSKSDMFDAFIADIGQTTIYTLEQYKEFSNPFSNIAGQEPEGYALGTLFNATNIESVFNIERWGWLKTYIMEFQNAERAAEQEGTKTIYELKETISESSAVWRFATAAFFVEKQYTGWPKSADFTEAGKDEAYFSAWGYSYELTNPKFPEEDVTLNAAEKEGCTFQGWYDNRWFTGEAVTTVGATTNGTLYAHWSSIMGDDDKTLNTLHTHYYDGTYVYASTIENKGSNKSLYNIDKTGEYFSDNNPKGDRKDITLVQEDWVAIAGLSDEDVNKEIAVGTAFTKVANADFPVISIASAAPQAASAIEVNNYRVANFNIGADNAHVNNIWLVAPQAGEYCHITGYVKAVSGDEVTLASSKDEADALEMTINIAGIDDKSTITAGTWYKLTGIVANGDKALKFNATAFEDVSTGVEASEIGSTIVRGMNGEIAVSVAAPATVNVYATNGALVATRNIADSDAIAVAPGFYIVKTDTTVAKVLVK